GVILSGGMSDGTAGLLAGPRAGGAGGGQDPAGAPGGAMPFSARPIARAHLTLPPAGPPPPPGGVGAGMAAPPTGGSPVADPIDKMPEAVERDFAQQVHDGRRGEVSVFTCPECGGSLWQVDEQKLVRFRCHVGHAYNGEALLAEQSEALEAALWTSVRTFREKSVLARQLALTERQKGNEESAARFEEQAAQAARYGHLIVKHVLHADPGGDSGPDTSVQDSPP